MTYQFLAWYGLGLLTMTLATVLLAIDDTRRARRRRAALPPPEAIRELAADLARLSRRINDYAASREEEREHAGAA